jgi:hypothetical protein
VAQKNGGTASVGRNAVMLANILLFSSISIAAMALFEVLLSEVQKQHVSMTLTKLWNRLDEFAKVPILLRLKRPAFFVLFTLISGIFALFYVILVWTDVFGQGVETHWRVAISLGCIAGFIGGLFFVRYIRGSATLGRMLLRFGLLYLISALFLMAPTIVMLLGLRPIPTHEFKFGSLGVLIAMPVFVLNLGFFIVGLGIAGSALLSLVLRMLEFTLRRVVEYPKGPMFGLSALLGAAAALLKSVGP